MSARTDIPPGTIGVDLREEGVEVEYLDGRRTLYRGVPEPVEEAVTAPPGTETHVLITDPTESEGVLVYVNDLKTADEILEDSGVGRVILDPGEEEELFPGVTARVSPGNSTEIEADPAVAQGRVFLFVEDARGEVSYEFVAPAGSDADSDSDEETGGTST